MKFRYLCSLGYNCGAAYQIRLHTGVEEALFFDWLYTSVDAATYLIKTDFRDFLDRSKVDVVRGGAEVLVRPSGIRLNHSFKPSGSHLVDGETMRTGFAAEKEKFDYLASKMRNMFDSGNAIGFVRYNPYPDHPDGAEKIMLLDAVISERLGTKNFNLFWVKNADTASAEVLSQTVVSISFPEDKTRSTSYRGADFIGTDDVAWRSFFSTLDLDLAQRRRALT